MGSELAVPPIFTPFEAAIHPRYADIDKQTAAWAESFRIGSDELRGRLVAHDIGAFCARILPEGREEVISLLSDFVLWLFGVDDGHCEEGELGRKPGELSGYVSQLIRIAQNPEAPMLLDDPLADGLRDLRRRVDKYGTVGQAARWVDALREYFLSVVWEAAHRTAGTVPGLNDYTLMRLYDGAASVVLPLLEMGHGYELQPHERDNTSVRAAAEMAFFLVCWDNDILSYQKEASTKEYFLNALLVLEREHGLDAEGALDLAISQRDRVMTRFLRHTRRLRVDASPMLCQYLDNLGSFIRGAQDWEISSVRYTTAGDSASPSAPFRDTPVDPRDEPLGIPAIDWWWDLK